MTSSRKTSLSKANEATLSPRRQTLLGVVVSLLTGMVLWVPASAHAAILYVDFNNNPQERATITTARDTNAPDEMTFYIPPENPQDALNLQKITNNRDQVWQSYDKHKCTADTACEVANPAAGACHDIYAKLKTLEDASTAAPKLMLTQNVLRTWLRQFLLQPQEVNGQEPITLILSGHFGGGVFTGNLGSLSVADIKTIFSAYPQIRNRVQRIFLLGCYTNTYSQITTLWRDAFPNANVIAGTYGQSTRGDDPENLSWITTLIANTPMFDQIQNQDDFTAMTTSLKKYTNFNTALAIGDFYQQIGSKQVQKVSDGALLMTNCQASLTPAAFDFYEGVFTGVKPIPVATNNSPLRSYYEELRNHSGCLADPVFKKAQPLTPDPDQVIRLILYPTVTSNFRTLHAKDLANFDSMLKALSIEPSLFARAANFDDRKALIAWVRALQDRLALVANRTAANNASNRLLGLQNTLVNLEPGCVPFSWVEPGATQPSTCFKVAGQCQ